MEDVRSWESILGLMIRYAHLLSHRGRQVVMYSVSGQVVLFRDIAAGGMLASSRPSTASSDRRPSRPPSPVLLPA
jgi:hypothetical protein